MPYEAALFIPSVSQSPGAEALRNAFKQLYEEKAKLSAARQVYTDNYPVVRDLITSVATLEKETIPQLAGKLLVTIKEREGQFDSRITSASADLQAIPARTIEEMRLRRSVSVAEGLYTTLKTRYAEAQLAEAGATPISPFSIRRWRRYSRPGILLRECWRSPFLPAWVRPLDSRCYSTRWMARFVTRIRW